MKPPAIDLRWFDRYLEDYSFLRLHMNHQPSSVNASRRDLKVFSDYCHDKHIRAVRGRTIIQFFTYVKTQRSNGSGAINRKRASLCTYIRHLQLRQIPGADTFPVKAIPRARDAYSGPVEVPERKEVVKILDGFDKTTVIGFRDYALFTLIYSLGLRLGEVLAINLQDIDWRRRILVVHGKWPISRKMTGESHGI